MYEGSVSELYVPYMDPATGWATRVFIDAGEFFPGGVLSPLREGIDCPTNASYFDALFTDDHGLPVMHSKQACLFELSPGQPAWRHYEKEEIWGRPSRVLILRTAMVIGNYDYLVDLRFERDGSIHVAVGATGVIEVKQVKEKTSAETTVQIAGEKDEYGNLVAEHTMGVNHDHFFSFRLDLDVDGQNNSFMADRLVKLRQGDQVDDLTRRSGLVWHHLGRQLDHTGFGLCKAQDSANQFIELVVTFAGPKAHRVSNSTQSKRPLKQRFRRGTR